MKMNKFAAIVLLAGVAVSVSSCCACRRAKSVPVAGTSWELIEIGGTAVNRAKSQADSYVLTFGEEGRYGGKADCNRYSGTGTVDQKQGIIDFHNPVSTRMMCPDQDAENAYMEMLGKAARFKIDGDVLMLSTAGNELLAVYKKRVE